MHDLIIKAISEKKIVEFNYHNHHRKAEPHVYGVLNGKKSILTYQTGGSSKSGGLPQWRRVNFDEITDFVITEDTFPGKRNYPSGVHSSFADIIIVVE